MKESREDAGGSKTNVLRVQLNDFFVPKETVESETVDEDSESENVSETKQTEQTYSEKLAGLNLDSLGNPYLTKTIQRRIDAWQNGLGIEQMAALAERMQMSVIEVETLLQSRMEELVQKSQFYCATQLDVFTNHILGGDKRYKSMMELYQSASLFRLELRSNVENHLFGFPKFDTPEGDVARFSRPTYGYFCLDDNGIFNEEGKHPPCNNLRYYGNVTVKIKKEVAMRRATISLLDSFGMAETPVCPAALPHFSAPFYMWNYPKKNLDIIQRFIDDPLDYETLWQLCSRFAEVQYHGGLTVEDIQSVHLSLGNDLDQAEIDEVTAAVEAYNRETGNTIPVVIY